MNWNKSDWLKKFNCKDCKERTELINFILEQRLLSIINRNKSDSAKSMRLLVFLKIFLSGPKLFSLNHKNDKINSIFKQFYVKDYNPSKIQCTIEV